MVDSEATTRDLSKAATKSLAQILLCRRLRGARLHLRKADASGERRLTGRCE